jgi:hypothetical protein
MSDWALGVSFLAGLVAGLALAPVLHWLVHQLEDDDRWIWYGDDELSGVEARRRLYRDDDRGVGR